MFWKNHNWNDLYYWHDWYYQYYYNDCLRNFIFKPIKKVKL